MTNIILFWLFGALIASLCLYFGGKRKLTLLQLIEAIIFSWFVVLFYVLTGLTAIIMWVLDKLENIIIIGN